MTGLEVGPLEDVGPTREWSASPRGITYQPMMGLSDGTPRTLVGLRLRGQEIKAGDVPTFHTVDSCKQWIESTIDPKYSVIVVQVITGSLGVP